MGGGVRPQDGRGEAVSALDFARIAAMSAGHAKAQALTEALRSYGFYAGFSGAVVTVDTDRSMADTMTGPTHTATFVSPTRTRSPIEVIKAWREAYGWGLAETKWLMERTDVVFDATKAGAVVASGYTEAHAADELRANRAKLREVKP